MLRGGLRLLAGLVLGWTSAAIAADATPTAPALEELMVQLAGSGDVRAHFVERKHLALLTEPLESEGELYFAPPDHMARVTTRPEPARLVIRGAFAYMVGVSHVRRRR